MIRNENNALYTGIAKDVEKRYLEHLSGSAKAARYTRSSTQLLLEYSCPVGDRSLASRVEYRIKQLNKALKEDIVSNSYDRESLFHFLSMDSD